MKRLICFLLVVIVQSATDAAETEQILTRLENDFAQAVVRRDRTTFQRLMAPSFVYTEDATVMNKEELKGLAGWQADQKLVRIIKELRREKRL
jgi:hypothetical protein